MKRLLKTKKIELTIDDFGISKGVNHAVDHILTNGFVTHLSLITGGEVFKEACQILHTHQKNVSVGLHFDLTFGNSCSKNPNLLTDKKRKFNKDFVGLLIRSWLNPISFQKQVQKELVSQIKKIQRAGFTVSHIDGHRHIQMIPAVWGVIDKYCKKNNINQVRFINESLPHTACSVRGFWACLSPVNLIKFGILKWCGRYIKLRYRFKPSKYFFSIIHSCKIDFTTLDTAHIPTKYDTVEIMLHPSEIEYDANNYNPEYTHLTSPDRTEEFSAAIYLKKALSKVPAN
jgi:predicted glycoside hydrolase/deacetylase ChbG (UPF0249 family)